MTFPSNALEWTPEGWKGKRKTKTHLDYKKTAEKERSMAGWKNWNAQRRQCKIDSWIEHITALCACWCYEKR